MKHKTWEQVNLNITPPGHDKKTAMFWKVHVHSSWNAYPMEFFLNINISIMFVVIFKLQALNNSEPTLP